MRGKLPYLMLSVAWFVCAASSLCFSQTISSPVDEPVPFLSPLFSDHMVFQRGKLNTIWGWSDPGDHITVRIGGHSVTGIAGPDRRWQIAIQPPPVGGPYTIQIHGRQTVELHDVFVGDVWLCGGQSNMEFALRGARTGYEDAKAAFYPKIRFFTVSGHPAYRPTEMIKGSWKVVSPETASEVSAVAYYFARRVQQQIRVPIGLVVDAVGGSPAEAWTSAGAIRSLHDFDVPMDELDKLAAADAPEYGNYVMHWYDDYDLGQKEGWSSVEHYDADWKQVTLRDGFAELGVPVTPAVAWFRKEIDLPDPLPPGRSAIFLGSIERMDTVYVNGQSVGGSAWVENPRVYYLRNGLLQPGKNVIAIRVLKTRADGGFLSKPADLHLVLGDGTNTSLAGSWMGKLSVDARAPHSLPIGYENWPVMPTVLYNGMLAPIAPFAITGVLWYQGEQNSERGYQYRKILPLMIADWRRVFGQASMPFLVVSLPQFQHRSETPQDDAWAETRESQAMTVATTHNTCLAVTIDTGDPDNLHPKDKEPVGDRLARCALAKYYGKKVVYSGPTMTHVDRLSSNIRIRFDHAEGGLVQKGAVLGEFDIAGEDRRWYRAEARIKGDTVVVSSALVPHPKEVRYAWASNPLATLFNGAGLPAGPFRTDSWPGITEGRRPY